MTRRPKDTLVVSRPLCVFIEEAWDLPGVWTATVVGHSLDHVTQGDGPVQALEMAADLMRMLTDQCSKTEDRHHILDVESEIMNVDFDADDNDRTILTSYDPPRMAWACSLCGEQYSKDSVVEVPDGVE